MIDATNKHIVAFIQEMHEWWGWDAGGGLAVFSKVLRVGLSKG